MIGIFFAGVATGVVGVFAVSLSVAMLAVRYMRRVDGNRGTGIGSEYGNHPNPMEGITYHGSANPPDAPQ
jgi:hypothetical protein